MHPSFEGMSADDIYSVYCHEAGHAVAALSQGRPISEMYLHPEEGFTSHGLEDGSKYEDNDRLFVVYAGPWAQARVFVEDVDSPGFGAEVARLLWANFCDWVEFQLSLHREISVEQCASLKFDSSLGAEPPFDSPFDSQWDTHLKTLATAIDKLATALARDQSEIEISVGDYHARLERVEALRWRQPGLDPTPDDGPHQCCEALVQFFEDTAGG